MKDLVGDLKPLLTTKLDAWKAIAVGWWCGGTAVLPMHGRQLWSAAAGLATIAAKHVNTVAPGLLHRYYAEWICGNRFLGAVNWLGY